MRVLLLSTYELGHQPLGVAGPAAVLAGAGHDVAAADLAIEEWPTELLGQADALVVSVPMHTATQLALQAVERARNDRPNLPVAFCGLYANVLAGHDVVRPGDLLVTGEAAGPLRQWAARISGAPAQDPVASGGASRVEIVTDIGPAKLTVAAPPLRSVLPPLSRYARLSVAGRELPAASIEASRGCNHHCRHCPVAAVYGGRSRAVPVESVLADVAQVVEAGAAHVSFADPDFLNRPRHALDVARRLHRAFPELTFDATVKVEHVLAHESMWPELAASGLVFVVSAFESTDDRVLALLDKGHVATEEADAVRVLRRVGIEARPSWMPFTPWTTLDSLAGILDLTARADLVWNTDPVQYSIRLLLPVGSLLLAAGDAELAESLRGTDVRAGTWSWQHRDPRMDELQQAVALVVERSEATGEDRDATFRQLWQILLSSGAPLPADPPPPAPGLASRIAGPDRPHLSESWFCCAEPTVAQLELLHRA